ncbi:MAG: glycosyltransferase family 2 protein [Planctomycetaceae bacterium]|jgi:succinoglycan biosynthesis protein ExoA|nr:glycosyltransferase family 2 protein [Planctomycetaceae bacterium]
MTRFISVVIPVRNEARHISLVLDSLLCQSYPLDRFEILVIDGCSEDATFGIVSDYVLRYSGRVRLFTNEKRLSSAARNIGVKNSCGDIILIVDGHCIISDWAMLLRVDELFSATGADCLGRPQPLEMANATLFQWAIASCRRSWLGHHPDSFIYSGVGCFVPAISVGVIYRREIFERIGYFDEGFDACEDVEFNYRLDVAGLSCYFDPCIAVRYVPRGTFCGLAFQMYRYGCGRVRLYCKHPATFSIKSFGLGFFVLWLIFCFCVSLFDICFFGGYFFAAYCCVLFFYLLVILIESVRVAILQYKLKILPLLVLVFLTIHLSFGWGIVREFFSSIFRFKFRIRH